jgi:glycosyltransferase involved in cell wall biosynthesis
MQVAEVRKVCFVVPQTYLFFNATVGAPFGGAERQAYLLGTALSERDEFEVHYCVADYGQGCREQRENCHLWPAFSFSENKFRALLKINIVLREINADVYIFRSANALICPIAFYLKYILKKKVVYMVAHLDEGSFAKLKQMSGWITAVMMKLTYPLADTLCVQTQEQAELFQGENSRGAHIVRNVFRPSLNMQNSENMRTITLWVGRCEPWKRPEIFLELARRNPEEKFVMVCPEGRAPDLFQRLKSEAESLPNLNFSGGVNPELLMSYFQQAKMYVLTSEAEGFANTMMEAMACTCPILSLGVDPDGIIVQLKLGLVASDTEDFFHHFEALAGDSELCRLFGENGKAYLLKNHVGGSVIDRFAELLS